MAALVEVRKNEICRDGGQKPVRRAESGNPDRRRFYSVYGVSVIDEPSTITIFNLRTTFPLSLPASAESHSSTCGCFALKIRHLGRVLNGGYGHRADWEPA